MNEREIIERLLTELNEELEYKIERKEHAEKVKNEHIVFYYDGAIDILESVINKLQFDLDRMDIK